MVVSTKLTRSAHDGASARWAIDLCQLSLGSCPIAVGGLAVANPLAVGDRVLFIDTKERRYLVTLESTGEFHSHAGFVPHAQVIGATEGVTVESTKGAKYVVMRPTLEDFVLEMPRGAQVIYPKDLAPIAMLADIGPGMLVFESGVGSGALSMTILRLGARIIGYELREDFAQRAKKNVASFLGEDALSRYHVELRDSYAGISLPSTDSAARFRSRRARLARAMAGDSASCECHARRWRRCCLHPEHHPGDQGAPVTRSGARRMGRTANTRSAASHLAH